MDHKQPDHDDGSPSRSLLAIKVINVPRENDGNDKVAERHANCTHNENRLTTDAVDPENGGNGGDEHDDADDAGRKKTGRCLAETELLEDRGCIVENLKGLVSQDCLIT